MTKKFLCSFGGTLLTVFAVLFTASFVTACGGGGGGGSTTVVTPPPAIDYSCDGATTLASMPRTAPYVSGSFDTLPIGSSSLVTTYERWPLVIDGVANELNIAITRPAGTPKGVVINGHGQSLAQATMLPSEMVVNYWEKAIAGRGYISVTVARRGNYGSTGAMVPSVTGTSASLQMAYFKYQSASLIAVLDKMATDPSYKPYLTAIILAGTSGGSDTVTQTASDSLVFKSAIKKAVIHVDGGVGTTIFTSSNQATNLINLNAMNEYGTVVGKTGTSSFWVVGDQDVVTSPPQVACQFKFYNQSAVSVGYSNTLFVVPGMGHASIIEVFDSSLRQQFREYMTARGFTDF